MRLKKVKEKKKVRIDDLDIQSVLIDLGVRIKDGKGAWYTCWCIFHDDGVNPNLRVNTNAGVFKCFSCGATGNILHIVEQVLGVDREGAWDYLSGAGKNRFITVESLKEKFRNKKKGGQDYTKQINKKIDKMYELVKLSEWKVKAINRAHRNRSNSIFKYLDSDRYTYLLMLDHIVDNMCSRVNRDTYYEINEELDNILIFAENTSFADKNRIDSRAFGSTCCIEKLDIKALH